MSTDDDLARRFTSMADDWLRDFFKALPPEMRRKEPPFEPFPDCPVCTGSGWITGPGSADGQVTEMCDCRFPAGGRMTAQ
jgi:hypothetical protein